MNMFLINGKKLFLIIRSNILIIIRINILDIMFDLIPVMCYYHDKFLPYIVYYN